MTLQRWAPFADLFRIGGAADRFWPALFRPSETPEGRENWGIPFDVVEKDGELLVRASLPGIKPEDIKVNVEDGVLSVKAELRDETETAGSRYVMRERRAGSFYRALRLPDTVEVDGVTSTYRDGVLAITLPRTERSRAREIEVKAA